LLIMERDFPKYMGLDQLSCSDVEELVDPYVDAELPLCICTKFQAHLMRCPTCAELVDDVVTIVEVARTLGSQVMPGGISERLRAHLAKEVGYSTRPKLTLVK
jgi:Putative zinc-finger